MNGPLTRQTGKQTYQMYAENRKTACQIIKHKYNEQQKKSLRKNPYVIELETMSGFPYPQAEEKVMKIEKLLLSL